METSQKSVE